MSASFILTVNAGSSSLRLDAFALPGLGRLAQRHAEIDTGGAGPATGLIGDWIAGLNLPPPMLVVHRVVHGGERLVAPVMIDGAVEAEIERLGTLAPLHNPLALGRIRELQSRWGDDVPQAAVFDTAFYAQLPAMAATYALPTALVRAHGIRRFGFHGLAHQAMLESWRTADPGAPAATRVISLQLGAGCSITASVGGQPVDTSMGFSPLEGLVMATRAGDVDPGVLLYLLQAGMSPAALTQLLNHESGLRGISGVSGDLRILLASGAPAARLAIDVYCHRLRKYLGAYLATLGGADAILFGGGVGEHSAEIRERVLDGLGFAGIRLDPALNAACAGQNGQSRNGHGRDRATAIGATGSATSLWVVPVDEAALLARHGLALLQASRSRSTA